MRVSRQSASWCRSLVAGVVSVGVFVAGVIGAPANAAALSARLTAEAKGGLQADVDVVTEAAVRSLAAGSATGALDASEPSASLAVSLTRGERLTAVLSGSDGTDFDLHLYWPGAAGAGYLGLAAAAVTTAYPETLVFDVSESGVYVLTVHRADGDGDFEVSWSSAPAVSDGRVIRVAGEDRYGTSVAGSVRAFKPGSVRNAVLASGVSFADSLAAAGLAGALGCPLLLTQPQGLPQAVADELVRLGARDVHIVGGEPAVSRGVAVRLQDLGYTVYRYGGTDRYETAAIVAGVVMGLNPSTPEAAFIARGDVFADALVVSPFAYARACPILLTPTGSLSPHTEAFLVSSGIPEVIVAGSEAAVSESIVSRIRNLPSRPAVTRIGGPDRYETARLIAESGLKRYWATADIVGVASGANFPDAVGGGAVIGAQGGVLLLTRPSAPTSQAEGFIGTYVGLGVLDEAVIFGGTPAIDGSVESRLRAVVER